jgi:hypothetical protein
MKIKNLLFALIMITGISNFSSAQITFQRTYGRLNGGWANSVQQTNDGGYIITGSIGIFPSGINDVYLIKTNANGDTLWTKTYGGTDIDECFSVKQTTDSGYIISGKTNSFGGSYLIKTTANGDTLWTKTYGGTSYSVQQTSDGGYIITGAGSFGVYLIRTTSNGDTLWTKEFGGIDEDYGRSVQQTTDGGFIITGTTKSFGSGYYDVYLIKTYANGDTLWTKTFGGTDFDWGCSVQHTSDSGYIITGVTKSFGAGGGDVYLIKTTINGDISWSKTFGGIHEDWGWSVMQTTDGGYIIAGGTASFGNDYYVYLIRTTENGDTLWTKTFGGTGSDCGYSVEQTADGGYIIAGITSSFGLTPSDVYLIKTDANGNSGCNQGNPATIVGNPATQQTSPATITTTPATVVTNPATIVGSGGTVTTLCTSGISELSPNSENINIYPNPTTDYLTIEAQEKVNIEILNLAGQIIKRVNTLAAQSTINISELAAGMYYIKVQTEKGIDVKKFIKE